MKVLHLPELVAGDVAGLSSALKALGIQSTVLARHKHPFGYEADIFISESASSSRWVVAVRTMMELRYLFGPWDVVHFNFGSTLLDGGYLERPIEKPSDVFLWLIRRLMEVGQWLELLTLSLRGVKIFVHFQGSDARQSANLKAVPSEWSGLNEKKMWKTDLKRNRYKKRRISRFDRFANKIYFLNPDLASFLPSRAEFLPYASVDVAAMEPPPAVSSGSDLVIAHAPSNRLVKGTAYLELAVEDLRSQGHAIQLDIIEDVKNEEVLRRLSLADVVVDQLEIGWYGALAVEAMALGKPVVCYINEDDLGVIDPEMKEELPIIRGSKDAIKEILLEICQIEGSKLVEIGRQSRKYSLKWHSPTFIASKVMRDYNSE